MRAAVLSVLGATSLIACADTRVVEVPDTSGAASVILAVRDGDRVELQAFALVDGGPSFETEVDSLESYDLYALVYEQSLDALGLARGRIPLVNDEPRRALAPAAREYVLLKDAEGAPDGWRAAEARPFAIDAARIRGTQSPCATFVRDALTDVPTAGGANNWAFALPRPGGTVVAGTTQGELFEIGRDARIKPLDGPPGFEPTAGVMDGTGRIFVGDRYGELWRGEPGSLPSTWARIAGTSPVLGIDFMDVSEDGAEVLVLTQDGRIARWREGGGWAVLHQLDTSIGATMEGGGVLRLGDEDVLAVGPSSRGVTRIRGVRVETESVDAMSAFTALRRIEGVGVVIGSGLGELFVRRAERWVSLGPSGSGFWVLGMSAYEGGFVWGSPYGNFGQHVDDQFCPVTNPVTFFVRFLVPLGADVLALGESYSPPAPQGAILRRR